MFFHAAAMAPLNTDNALNFHSFANGIEDYRNLKNVWKPRLFANALAAEVVTGCYAIWPKLKLPGVRTAKQFTVGLWTATWFFAIGLLYIFSCGERSLFYILGTFAGVCFAYIPGLLSRIYPWDMPVIFIYTASVLLLVRQRFAWLLALLMVGMGFKETTGVLCLTLLFINAPWKRRLRLSALAVALCLVMKIAIDHYTHADIPIYTMETVYTYGEAKGTTFLAYNLYTLSRLHVLLVNSGTLLAFLILPAPNRTTLALKAVACVFVTALLVFGLIDEYRIFFEMIPLALYALGTAIFGDDTYKESES